MRRFELVRREDLSGVSGTGVVAQGVVFDTGRVVMAWLTRVHSVAVYDCIEHVLHIHGHDGASVVQFLDD